MVTISGTYLDYKIWIEAVALTVIKVYMIDLDLSVFGILIFLYTLILLVF